MKRALLTAVCVFAAWETGSANGIYRDGVGAESMALGGSNVMLSNSPLSALASNPALWSGMRQLQLEGSIAGGYLDSTFSSPGSGKTSLDNNFNVIPDIALAIPVTDMPVTFGVGITVDGAAESDSTFLDVPGTAGASYGVTQHFSKIVLIRGGAGVGVQATSWLSLGGGVGVLYNENDLEGPYIFQSHPILKGLKTDLDLHTSGFGVNGTFGAAIKPVENVQIGLSYRTESVVATKGTASGELNSQFKALGAPFNAAPSSYQYDAEVVNVFPQMASVGVAWQINPQWKWVGQIDWTDWSRAFDHLPVHLRNGSNPAVNGLLGTNSINDNVPLNWKDTFVYRTGLEWQAIEKMKLRIGYSYGNSTVPDQTLTPMTAAISEHVFTAGAGYNFGTWGVDFAYQYALPVEQSVGVSGLAAGEYNNSKFEYQAHIFSLSVKVGF